MLQAVLPFCHRPAPSKVPDDCAALCSGLVRAEFSFVEVYEEDAEGNKHKVLKLHHWPSWLRVGGRLVVAACVEFFYT